MTRNPTPVAPPVVVSIAGSDSGGGAGIQADLKTIEAGGAFGTSVITSVTAQNTTGVESTHVLPIEEIDAQSGAVFSDFDVAAIKTGMLATSDVIELVTERVAGSDAPAVVDPVMVAASGDRLLDRAAEDAYGSLLAEATLVTPNADEAEVLSGIEVTGSDSARDAGAAIVDAGAEAALVKGGHVPGDEVVDVLVTGEAVERIRHPRVETDATHGSGCTLSSAIATRLAQGESLTAAVEDGVDLLARAVRYNIDVGEGPGSVHHMVAARDRMDQSGTVERVSEIVRQFVRRDVGPLVPEVGMNVVGATPYAEVPADCVAVEGRISRTLDGVAPTRGVRVGAASHVASALLGARESDGAVRFAVNCRFDDGVEAALGSLEWTVAEFDRGDEPADRTERMGWGTRRALEGADTTPDAVVDPGGFGTEPTVLLVTREPATLVDRTVTLLDAVTDEQ